MALVTSGKARSRTIRLPPAAVTSAITWSALAVSAAVKTHLATTQLSATTSDIAHAILRDVRRTVREVTVLGNEFAMELLHAGQPGPDVLPFDRLHGERHPLVFGELDRAEGLEHTA